MAQEYQIAQVAGEVVSPGTPNAVVAQLAIEAVRPAASKAQMSNFVIEALCATAQYVYVPHRRTRITNIN